MCSCLGQTIFLEMEEMPESFEQQISDSLYTDLSKRVIDYCDSTYLQLYGFRQNIEIYHKQEILSEDSLKLTISLVDTVRDDGLRFFYEIFLYEKDHFYGGLSGFISKKNTTYLQVLNELLKNVPVVLNNTISKEIKGEPHNISMSQRDSLSLHKNFKEVIINFRAEDNVKESDFQFIKNQITNEWNLTQIKIWRHAKINLSKHAYFNLYYTNENNKINSNDFIKVVYTLYRKDQNNYELVRKVSGKDIENVSVKENYEIDLNKFRKYPFSTLSGRGGSYILMKDLFNLWGY